MLMAQGKPVLDSASSIAPEIDAIFWTLVGISVFFTVLIAILVMYFAIRYRRRSEKEVPRAVVGSLRLELVWTIIPAIIGLFIFWWSARVYFKIYRAPDDATTIYVVGKQWMWKLQHPGGQREINELHVPLGEPIRLKMISEDVIHSFYIPAFRIKQDVLPGRYSSIWFKATKKGRYDIFCAEYCGTHHSRMIGTVVVLEPDEYQRWLTERATGSAADHGRQLFYKLRCVTCHAPGDGGQTRAPLLENLFGQSRPMDDGTTIKADEDYIRRSILEPNAQVVAGYRRPTIMPTYKGQVSEEEILQLVAFIRSLKTGGTPARTDTGQPPATRPEPRP